METIIRKPYEPHDRVYNLTPGKSLVMLSAQKECDINQIMQRYIKTGILDHAREHQGDYGAFMLGGNYHDAMNKVLAAQEAFGTIPAEVRLTFNNDPGEFLEFVQDPENLEKMYEMGLAERPPRTAETPPEDPPAPVDPPPPEGPEAV